ncbi:MAG: hypothetical protein AMJ84_02360 [Acidithiobacillales bacterium SM23_46]|nr:MAG: hypothetical protein AMJ84_02360 [Acidithiobacillales bacterium SM23_46]
MLNHSLLKFDGSGRIRNTADAPTHFSGGLPFNADGVLCVELPGTVDHQHNGQGYAADGKLAGVLGSVESFAQGGLPMNAGRIVVATAAAIDHYNSGLPCSASGALCVAAQE